MENGVFPKNSKLARVSDIFKGRSFRNNLGNYRPIFVLSVIARLFEKLVHQQLFSFTKDSLAKMQSGFRAGFSTETSPLHTTNQSILNIDRKGAIFGLILARKLEHYSIRDTKLRWFQSYLSDRS